MTLRKGFHNIQGQNCGLSKLISDKLRQAVYRTGLFYTLENCTIVFLLPCR